MKTKIGHILEDVTTGVILQQVNAQGVMGKGFALAIKEKWPIVWEEYSKYTGPPYTRKDNGFHLLGNVLLTEVQDRLYVANLFGQQFFYRLGQPRGTRFTSYDALDRSFTNLAEMLQGIPVPIHFPMIGSGLGGGHWPIIKEIMMHRLQGFELNLWLLPDTAELV